MYCPKCHKENPDGAMFCNYCGAKLKVDTEKSNKLSNNLLIAWTAAFVIITLLQFILPRLLYALFDAYHLIHFFDFILAIAFNLIMLLPVIAIRNKTFRIIGIVIMSIIILLRFIWYYYDLYYF